MLKSIQETDGPEHLEKDSRSTQSHTGQMARRERVLQRITRLYEAANESHKASGGDEVIAREIHGDEGAGKVLSSMWSGRNRQRGMHYQLDWLAAQASPDNYENIRGFLDALLKECGCEPSLRVRQYSEEQENKAKAETLEEMCADPEMREMAKKKIARRLGVRPDRVKL